MAQITFINFDGTEHVIDVKPGLSVMEGAMQNNIPGIDAECVGGCSCGTCQVYVEDAWYNKIKDASSLEKAMLDCAANVKPNSRLCCQITVDESLHGLIVRIPESQSH